MIETYSHASDECYANLLDILEQLFLIIYYFYENLVFISRTKLVWFTEDMLDDWGNWSWFFEDFLCFAASLMRTYISHRNWSRHTVENYCDNQHVDIGKGHAKYPKPALSGRRLVESNDLRRKLVDSSLSMTIVSTVTLSYVFVLYLSGTMLSIRRLWNWEHPLRQWTCFAHFLELPSETRAWACVGWRPPC